MRRDAGDRRSIIWFMLMVLMVAGSAFALDVAVTNAPYSAVPDDENNDSAAFSSALKAIVTAGGGTLTVPCGNYYFTSQIAVNLSNTTVTVRGDGTGVSIIHCANTTGLFQFNNTSSGNQLIISGVTLMADMAGGSAVEVNNPTLSFAPICSLRMENFNVMALNANCYFSRTITATNLQQPQFINFFIEIGNIDLSLHGISIDSVNSPTFDHGYTRSLGTGIRLMNASGDVLDTRVYQVGVSTGLWVSARAGTNCTVTMKNCHTNPRWKAAHIIDASQVNLLEGMAYVNSNLVTVSCTDYTLENCTNVLIQGCNFHQTFFGKATWRTMIHLKGTTSGVLIKDLIFNGAGSDAATAILQDPGVTGVTAVTNLYRPTFGL